MIFFRLPTFRLTSFLFLFMICACKKARQNEDSPPAPKSSERIVKSFVFSELSPAVTANVDTVLKTIKFSLSSTVIINNLKPTIVVSDRATINPQSQTALNFSTPQVYVVTAENGDTAVYRTQVTIVRSTEKVIKTFSFNDLSPTVNATVDTLARTVKFSLLPAIDPSNLRPTITVSNLASVSPQSLIPQNFINPRTYAVTAEDGTSNNYTTELLKPAPSAKDVPAPPKYLCIYYAWPSVVNGSAGNTSAAINVFKNYDLVVFGGGIWETTHGDYAKTKTIIAGLKAAKPSIRIFGYIDVGVSPLPAQNLSIAQLQTAIDGWKDMGVHGIFGDDFGYDFQVTRSRQNAFIDYAHSKGLSVFANSWNIDDALGGSDCHLDGSFNDFCLLESFLVAQNVYRPLGEFKSRGDKAYFYMKTKKIGIACTSTLSSSNLSSTSANTDKFRQSWHGAAMYNFDAFQFTDDNLSASNATVYFYTNPVTSYGTGWIDLDWVRKISEMRYERSTNTNTFYITGDGTSNGTGGH